MFGLLGCPGFSKSTFVHRFSGFSGALGLHFFSKFPENPGNFKKSPGIPRNSRNFPGIPGHPRKLPELPGNLQKGKDRERNNQKKGWATAQGVCRCLAPGMPQSCPRSSSKLGPRADPGLGPWGLHFFTFSEFPGNPGTSRASPETPGTSRKFAK